MPKEAWECSVRRSQRKGGPTINRRTGSWAAINDGIPKKCSRDKVHWSCILHVQRTRDGQIWFVCIIATRCCSKWARGPFHSCPLSNLRYHQKLSDPTHGIHRSASLWIDKFKSCAKRDIGHEIFQPHTFAAKGRLYLGLKHLASSADFTTIPTSFLSVQSRVKDKDGRWWWWWWFPKNGSQLTLHHNCSSRTQGNLQARYGYMTDGTSSEATTILNQSNVPTSILIVLAWVLSTSLQ